MTTQDRWTPWPEHKNPTPTRLDRFASAPYNFVPLPEEVVSAVASADELPCHDEYRRGSHSGYFDVTLTTRSPLYIRGPLTSAEYQRLEQDPQLKNKPEFFHTGDARKPVIPGSSLRGMLRGLLEIVSYSKMQWVSEKQLFFRTVDDTAVGKQYRDRMGGHVETGFLMRRGDTYFIKVCQMARVNRSKIGESLNPLYSGTAPNKVPRWKNQQGQPLQYAPVWARLQDTANVVEELSDIKCVGMYEGRLVITGDMPGAKNKSGKQKRGKQKEFFFFLPEHDAEEIIVPDEIINRFHDDDQLTQWQEKAFPVDLPKQRYRERDGMLGRKPEAPGDPIFFLRENGKLTFIGRAQMFRLPYKQSPLALVDQSLRCAKQIDYAEALFGFVRTGQQLQEWDKEPPKQGEKGRAYAGRVIVTDAVLQSEPADIWLADRAIVPKILASPKPTAFQHYLTQRQPDDKFKLDHYDNRPSNGHLTTTIRGYKLYWHQGLGLDQGLDLEKIRNAIEDGFAQAEAPAETSLDTQHTRMKPLKPGVVFSFRVHFENLSERDLGALCWTLHPRGEAEKRYCHHLGMGKPLGMGAVELHARLHLIDREQRYSALFSDNTWQSGETRAVDNSKESMGKDLKIPEVLEDLTRSFERHLLDELKPDLSCDNLNDMRRIAILLKLLEWPGYRTIEGESTYLEKENPPRPNTRYMTIQPNEYRHRPVLPDPTAFDPALFKDKASPTEKTYPQGNGGGASPTSPARHPVPDPPAGDSDMQRAKEAARTLEAMRESEVAGQIPNYHQRWQRLTSLEARELLAQAILEKVRKAKREKASAEKAWYKELVAFLQSQEGKG